MANFAAYKKIFYHSRILGYRVLCSLENAFVTKGTIQSPWQTVQVQFLVMIYYSSLTKSKVVLTQEYLVGGTLCIPNFHV